MEGKHSYRKWRGFGAITASLMTIAVGGVAIVNANAAFINSRLGTTNIKLVETGDGTQDTDYFKSSFGTLSEVIEAKEALAEMIASEGTVLLKNSGAALPISKTDKVTVWGMNSVNPVLGGMIGSSVAVNADAGQLSYGILEALEAKGLTVNSEMTDLYNSDAAQKSGKRVIQPSFGPIYEDPSVYGIGEMDPSLYTSSVLSSADSTVAICFISRGSSEAADYSTKMKSPEGDGDTYDVPLALSAYEKAMIEQAKAHSTKVIVMLNASNPIEIEELKQDSGIDAIVWTGDPGAYGFLGVVDVLTGEVNPSGHITDTYAVDSTSSPAMVNFGVYNYTNASTSKDSGAMDSNNKSDWFVVEGEGIYDGYKYYETRYEDEILGQGNATSKEGSSDGKAWSYAGEVSYPFGYGLSYTTFEQKLNSVNVEIGGESSASVTVKNTGKEAGKSVVQLYVQAPYTEGGIEKSAIQLVGFGKTAELAPGESEAVEISFDASYFASYDEKTANQLGTEGAWVLEAGDYYFAIGNGAHEALNNVLASKTGSTAGLVSINDDEVINASNAVKWNLAATDSTTYSENVENQLQDMDINNYIPDTVEYTTRADWSKGWTTIESITPVEGMMTGLNNANYQLSANGDGVTWGADNGLTILDMINLDENGNYAGVKALDDPAWDLLIDEITLDEAIQFIEKGGDDVENIDSILLNRTYANDGPIGYAGDQVSDYTYRWSASNSGEATYVTAKDDKATYTMATMPTDPVVAATFNTELAYQEGQLFGEDSLWANESSLFAPGMNLHRTPYCSRNHEYYSEDPMLTSLIGTAVCVGGEEKGTQMEPKHFAFNHQESNRSGISTFMNEQAARENELRCFQLVMSSNSCQGIMTAFNRAGTVYVGAFRNLLVNIARNEWGYTGWYNTDMINGTEYMNWRDITAAGGGNCLTTSAYDSSVIGTMAKSKNIIAKDTQFQQTMKQSLKYWMYNLASSNSMNGISQTTKIKHVLTWYQLLLIAVSAVTGVLTILFAALGVMASKKEASGSVATGNETMNGRKENEQ